MASIWDDRILEPDAILLGDQVAIVTGAAQGIGRATALAMARFGADVAICDRKAPELEETAAGIRAQGRRCVSEIADVREQDAVAAFLAAVESEFGSVQILVNNAGGGFWSNFLDVNAKGENALIRENFGSVTLFIRGTVPLMREGGSIINVTSVEAHRAGPGYAIYSAMKAAVASLTRSLALELGDRGIRVNCVAPDLVPTAASGPMPVSAALERSGDVDDVAAAVVFLAGRGARFVTGTTLHVDGGGLAAAGWRRDGRGGFTPA
jgi:NAD(P)-dependent dehydrogenase (short-subunit alcohol dehydrogenase family)